MVGGDFGLKSVPSLSILLGGQGGNKGGGGGGTFVVAPSNTPLVVAGGGGGASIYGVDTGNASAGTSGNSGFPIGGSGGTGGNGGAKPLASNHTNAQGAGGGGFLGNGESNDPASKIREGLYKRKTRKWKRHKAGMRGAMTASSRKTPWRLSKAAGKPKKWPVIWASRIGCGRTGAKLALSGKEQTQVGTLEAESSTQREIRRLRQENDYLRRQGDILKKGLGIVSVDVPGSVLR